MTEEHTTQNAEQMYFEKKFNKKTKHSRTIAVDYDGVINSYKTRTGLDKQYLLPDPPVDGALEWVLQVMERFNVVVFTCRAFFPGGKEAVEKWLERHGFPALEVTGEKPIAHVYLDDRGFRFEGPGTFPTLEELNLFKPWNRK